MNRVGLGLAIGAGYVLGRTKKAKLALAVGSLVAGKKLNLSPRAVAELAGRQLRENPQFKEIGDQLREDLRGVGKAASGAMVERQMSALADRLHGRTGEVREQLTGALSGSGSDEEEDEGRDDEVRDEDDRDEDDRDDQDRDDDREARGRSSRGKSGAGEKRPAKKAPAKKAPAAEKGGARKPAAKKAPAKKTAAKKTGTARRTAGKKTAAAGSASRGARNRLPKGGDDR
ncbi:DNA primase [Streptomyces sp. NPDC047028]|uniref:DNA primase n=1 Tax=Streptomyces sp. NPDC047028 TaxID=3155793 RepID=UPI0033D05BA8